MAATLEASGIDRHSVSARLVRTSTLACQYAVRNWLIAFAITLAAVSTAADALAAEGSAEGLPNIVLVYCDDAGYGDFGCYGNSRIRTPAVDRLAQEGMRFTDFYVAQAVCSASRTSLLTGCYPNRVGILGALGPNSQIGIHDDELTLGELLQSRGYATAAYGKWHLGDNPRFLPARHGFDDYFGLPYSNDMWPKHPERPGAFPSLPLISGVKTVETDPDQSRLTRRYTDHAVAFIEQHHAKPFFVYLPHTMPHVPIFASDDFRGQSVAGLYGDVIEEIDNSLDRISKTLEELRIDEKTIVIFASDNGPWLSYGNHAGTAGPLREGKGTTFEGGVRVPCVVRWPGHVPAGTICREPAMTIDWLPTLAAISGAALPQDRVLDGQDISPLLMGEAGAVSPHEALYFYWGRALEAVRAGRWKLHLPHRYRTLPPGERGRDGLPVKYAEAAIGTELFDLAEDPAEKHNVADGHPDIVARLQALAEQARQDLGDSATGQQGKNVRAPGNLR
ncbi:MAG: sulfatase-like hydrolase/transferase [Pirellulales bacterium]